MKEGPLREQPQFRGLRGRLCLQEPLVMQTQEDQLVYKLYGLTEEEEMAIVEGAG